MSSHQQRYVILVTGLPGAGKTTLARQLSAALSLPLLSRDVIKEAMFTSLSHGPELSRQSIGQASVKVLYEQMKDMPAGVIIESWINTERGDEKHLEAALAAASIQYVYEIFCHCPGEVAAQRYDHRHRSPVHRSGRSVVELISSLAPKVKPLGLGPVLTVETSQPVGTSDITDWLKAQMR